MRLSFVTYRRWLRQGSAALLLLGALIVSAIMFTGVNQGRDELGGTRVLTLLNGGLERGLSELDSILTSSKIIRESIFVFHFDQNISKQVSSNDRLNLFGFERASTSLASMRGNKNTWERFNFLFIQKKPRVLKTLGRWDASESNLQLFRSGVPTIDEAIHKVHVVRTVSGVWRNIGLDENRIKESSLRCAISCQRIAQRRIGIPQNTSLQSGDDGKHSSKKTEWLEKIFYPAAGIMLIIAAVGFWILAAHFNGFPLAALFWFLMFIALIMSFSLLGVAHSRSENVVVEATL